MFRGSVCIQQYVVRHAKTKLTQDLLGGMFVDCAAACG